MRRLLARWRNAITLWLQAGCCSDRLPQAAPTPEELAATRAALATHLDGQILPFWVSPAVNHERFGGFVPHLDRRLRFTGETERGAIVQLRLLYTHAIAIARAKDASRQTELRGQYRRRLSFLVDHYRDDDTGGFFTLPDETSAAAREDMETRVQIHALYLLASVHRLIGCPQALDLARCAVALLREQARDERFGGYLSFFALPPDHPRNAVKPLQDHIHATLGLFRMHQVAPDDRQRTEIDTLLDLLIEKYEIGDRSGLMYNGLAFDWQPLPPDGSNVARTFFGHSAEAIWYATKIVRSLNIVRDDFTAWVTRVADALLEHGISRHGAAYSAGDYRGRPAALDSFWWAQAEMMVTFLRTYELTGTVRYYRTFEAIRDWTFRHLVPDTEGPWLPYRSAWGFRRARTRSGRHWQAGYHVARALLECEAALDRLARGDTSEGGEAAAFM